MYSIISKSLVTKLNAVKTNILTVESFYFNHNNTYIRFNLTEGLDFKIKNTDHSKKVFINKIKKLGVNSIEEMVGKTFKFSVCITNNYLQLFPVELITF